MAASVHDFDYSVKTAVIKKSVKGERSSVREQLSSALKWESKLRSVETKFGVVGVRSLILGWLSWLRWRWAQQGDTLKLGMGTWV